MATSSNSFSEGSGMNTEAIQCPRATTSWYRGSSSTGRMGDSVVSSTGLRGTGKAFWTATKVPEEKCIPVGTFRCSVYGFLESYARPEFAAR
jgi:hypothetical protein